MHSTIRTLLPIFVILLLATPAVAEQSKGEGVYMNFCSSCHASGVAGAPKVGDKANWEPRIAQGIDTLVKHSIEGYKGPNGYMPAKGGNQALTDEEVTSAVHYMVDMSK